MEKEIKTAIETLNKDWGEFKAVLAAGSEEQKKYGTRLGETEAKLDQINAALAKSEKRMDEVEKASQRPALEVKIGIKGVNLNSEEYRTAVQEYDGFLRKGVNLSAPSAKVLRVDDDTTGGFGAPAEFTGEMLKGLIEISPVRGEVRVRNTGNRSVRVMKRTGTFTAVWVGAVGTKSETTGYALGMEEIPTHEIYALVDVGNQDLEDNDFNLEGELKMEFAEQFAKAEGIAVVAGTASGQPEGINVNSAISEDTSGHATQVTYDGMVDVSHNIKIGYLANSKFYFNLGTLGALRKITSGAGEPLWTPMAADSPSTILGFRYAIWQDLPAVSANLFPVFFGDMRKAYYLVDRVAMQILRDPYTQNAAGATRFTARKRLGGQVVIAEALRKLKIST